MVWTRPHYNSISNFSGQPFSFDSMGVHSSYVTGCRRPAVTVLAFKDLHDGAMARDSGQGSMAGENGCIKCLRQGNVSGTVSCNLAAQSPDAIEEWPVGEALNNHSLSVHFVVDNNNNHVILNRGASTRWLARSLPSPSTSVADRRYIKRLSKMYQKQKG